MIFFYFKWCIPSSLPYDMLEKRTYCTKDNIKISAESAHRLSSADKTDLHYLICTYAPQYEGT